MGPSEAILEIEGLPLKEKLALWSTTAIDVEWYRKMDIRDYILILDKIRRYHLSEEDQWRIMKLPMDVHNEEDSLNAVTSLLIATLFEEKLNSKTLSKRRKLTNIRNLLSESKSLLFFL